MCPQFNVESMVPSCFCFALGKRLTKDIECLLVQGFINSSFENITSTDHALNLLHQFQSILLRDSLRADLNAKYMVIFQNYGLDVDSVQKAYEMQKNNPPVPRNAPPVSGNIMWSKQLLARIEEPMKKFADNKMIMSTKESKRIVKTYNKVRNSSSPTRRKTCLGYSAEI